MNYVSQARTPQPAALLGAVAIPLGVGALLVASLAFTVVINKDDKPFQGFTVTPEPIEPTPEPPETQPDARVDNPVTQQELPDIIVPDTPIVLTQPPVIGTNDFELPDIVIVPPTRRGSEGTATRPSPILDPIAVVPRNNPGSWITEGDYRTRWINEGLSGVANFNLEVGTNGRVTNCTITRSTGHAVLDGATCRLIERRARFKPARNEAGDKVVGVYSSSISWEIPD